MHLQNNNLLQGGKYKIVRFIASGCFGCTYEAHHTLLDLRVALKEFFVSDFCNRNEYTGNVSVGTQSKMELYGKLKKKFLEEARSLYKMKHPGIVRVIDVFEENGTAYYAMEYIDGESLGDLVKRKGKLPEAEVVGYIRQVAEALKYVHSLNRLHLDIKPGNIMLNKDGKAVLIDFGASKHYDDETGENTSTLLGINTKGYAPVEQVNQSFRSFSPATDIYALGATLYKLLTGITPPPSTLLHSEEATLDPLPSYVSTSTRHAVEAAMQLLRKNRPQSVKEWLAILIDEEDTNVEIDVPEPEPGPRPEPLKQSLPQDTQDNLFKPKRTKWIAAGVVAVILVSIVIWRPWQNDSTDDIDIDPIENNNPVKDDEILDGTPIPITVNGVTFNMIKVEDGTFTMGATSEMTEPWDDEKPTHKVTLSSYYIGETEVTQALWKAVMGSNPSFFKGDDLPVEEVSWDDCQDFILKLNSITKRSFRLPTEAEWEFAARGGNKSKHTQYSGSGNIGEVAWYDGNSGSKTHPVKTKKANELGIYDMSGNVWEWCQDWYGSYSNCAQDNPTGPNSGTRRVDRGGSWGYSAGFCRSSDRNCSTPDFSYDFLGLRLVLSE